MIGKVRLAPTMAILKHDLGTLASSWLVRAWLIASGLFVLLLIAGQWRTFPDAPMIALILFPYLVLPWYLVVIMLGIGPVAGNRIESLADGILSRPVTRYEYLLASWAARVIAVLGVFLIVAVPAILLVVFADRPAPDDAVTSYGVLASLLVVSLVLTLQVSLAFLLGTLLRRAMVAVAALALGWFILGSLLAMFQLEELSPISLNQAIPTLLRQPWTEPEETAPAMELDQFSEVFKPVGDLFGISAPAPRPKPRERFFESEDYDDFSLGRVLLGYGAPTLLSIVLATLVFCRRDL